MKTQTLQQRIDAANAAAKARKAAEAKRQEWLRRVADEKARRRSQVGTTSADDITRNLKDVAEAEAKARRTSR